MGDTPKFDDFCRICAEEFNCSLYVFSEAGKQLLLQDRIQKYLTIVINIDDKLPKMICANCITRLDGIDKFARLALRAQERFTALMNNDEGMFSTLKSDTDDVDSEMCAIETMSNVDFNHETEPDIKIDPLLYVQCSLDDSINSEDSPQSSPKKFNADTIALLGDHNYFISNEDERIPSPLQYQDCFKIENETDYDSNDIVKLLITDHDNIEKFYCTSCPQVFSNDTDLRNHMWRHLFKSHNITIETSDSLQSDNKIVIPETSASREPVHVPCPICGKRLSTKGNLKVHLETHSPKGKYECNICGRIFRSESNLCSHKEYHTVSYKFTCEVCRRVYPTSSTLRAHSITHSDARPHACSLCNKTFKRNQDLKFHLNQHTGARPYQCPYCPKAFASSGNCFSHRKRMHPSEVERDRERAAAAIAK